MGSLLEFRLELHA